MEGMQETKLTFDVTRDESKQSKGLKIVAAAQHIHDGW